MDDFVHNVYDCSRTFPRDETYGVTSQLRRAALSVVLNYIEGFARQRTNVLRHFLEMSYGSLKEADWLIDFSLRRRYLKSAQHEELKRKADRIGRMLWGTIAKLK